MLFHGRPFAVELINPKVAKFAFEELSILQKTINQKNQNVNISGSLKIITKDDLKVLKTGENQKSKTYRALCIVSKNVNISCVAENLRKIKHFKIMQKTPIRVVHRRSLFPRERMVYECRARVPSMKELQKYRLNFLFSNTDSLFIIFDLKTQAGTYVKEFIHGDFGRTFPNLCSFLQIKIDIAALDVVDVALNWP